MIPPDWVFYVAWPLLKLAALAADRRVLAAEADGLRRKLVTLRCVDWLLFFAFPRLAARTGSAVAVSALTAAQAATTGAVMRRTHGRDVVITRLLAPQFAWLVYATVVPLIIGVRSRKHAH